MPATSFATVLIVDDMKLARLKLTQICKSLGCQNIIEASNGDEAWNLLSSGTVRPDIVLTDYNMPTMNGMQLLEKIRGDEKLLTLPVIFVTSESEKSLILNAVTLGVAEFVIKPFTDEAIVQKIQEALKVS